MMGDIMPLDFIYITSDEDLAFEIEAEFENLTKSNKNRDSGYCGCGVKKSKRFENCYEVGFVTYDERKINKKWTIKEVQKLIEQIEQEYYKKENKNEK